MNISASPATLSSGSAIQASNDGIDDIKYVETASVFFSIFMVGIVGNALVIFVLFKQRSTWNVTTTYLFNLALADAIFVCTLPMWAQTYLNHMEWIYGQFMCKTVGFLTGLNMFASIFFLTAMSVDRWIAVVHSTSVGVIRTSRIARIVSICVWMGAGVLSIPRLIFQKVIMAGNMDTNVIDNVTNTPLTTTTLPDGTIYVRTTTEEPQVQAICMIWIEPSNKKEFIMGLLELVNGLVGFVIPMTVICVCYARIIVTVKKKLISKRMRKERVAILAASIIAVFFICWLPMQMMNLYSALGGWWNLFPFSPPIFHKLFPFCICLAYANSCINPFIYAFTASNFKNNVKDVCGASRNRNEHLQKPGSYKMTLNNKHDNNGNVDNAKAQISNTEDKSIKKTERGNYKPVEASVAESSYETYEYYSCPPVVQGIFDVPTNYISESMSDVAYSTPDYFQQENGNNNQKPLRKFSTINENVPLNEICNA